MQQHDDVVSGWLDGSDNCGGQDNPAGPLYLDSSAEEKMTGQSAAAIFTTQKTTQSCASGCICC
ncbi:DUF6229 family protein [Dyella acidiphila]|uniref:Uncharacterized protein n=1 Tax=Dyella acidiphila TaxID=2775866 RepID=A0ABR9GCL6_9GAMM|nr:DUF6229 family protein [Dyella acidiphila]MBE1161785.1 hypothetical protein [Dyella acidiphila]